jgi:hypothetical protein
VKTIFKDIPLMRAVGVQALDIRDQKEVSMKDGIRTCQGVVRGSNTREYGVRYTIEQRGDQIFTNVDLWH